MARPWFLREKLAPVLVVAANLIFPSNSLLADPFVRSFLTALVEGARGTQRDLPKIIRASESCAQRLVQGGDLFIASVREDFIAEGIVRSGGMMMIKPYRDATKLSRGDCVVFGWSNSTADQDGALAKKLGASGAFVVGIGPKPARQSTGDVLANVASHLESAPPLPREVLQRFGGEAYPLVSLQNLVLLWSFTGELVSALTREGHMPTMYQSVLVTGARKRNAGLLDQRFHKGLIIPPIPAGQLGRNYFEKLAACLESLSRHEIPSIEKVAQASLATRKGGHKVHAWLISHFPDLQPGAPGDPGWMHQLERISGEVPTVARVAEALKPGDLFFFLGYYRRPTDSYEVARKAGAKIAEVIAGTDVPETGRPLPDYVIHPHWTYGDSLVQVANYDVTILPSSGIVQAAVWWSVIGAGSEGS